MVMVYCEGPTEWYVIRKLNEYNVLKGDLIDKDNVDIHIVNSPKKITRDFILKCPLKWNKFLLIYDQENYSSPRDFADNEFNHLSPWFHISDNENILYTNIENKLVYLHVNVSPSPNGYKDFDGYLKELITRMGHQLVQLIMSNNNLIPSYIRELANSNNIFADIHQMGVDEIPNLMDDKKFTIQRSKGHLYAYIAASQISKSHVWFAEKIVEIILKNGFLDQVNVVFNSLIEAWNRLVGVQST